MSEHKDAAWSFVEDSLVQEKSELYESLFINYPALKKRLNKQVEKVIEAGSKLTWDEVNVMLELIPDAMPFYSVKDYEIIKIISEEAPAYYSGQKGIDDVVSVIQNRVQLYVNENM